MKKAKNKPDQKTRMCFRLESPTRPRKKNVCDTSQSRVALIHGEKLRIQQTCLQEKLVDHFGAHKLVVVNHNSGHLGVGEDSGELPKSCSLGISLLATQSDGVAKMLQNALGVKRGVCIDENGRIHFRRRRSFETSRFSKRR